jgi:hypothetical protein
MSVSPKASDARPGAGAEFTRTVLAAATNARRRYPGPVGELLHRELMAWHAFGHHLGRDGLLLRLLDELGAPVADEQHPPADQLAA